MGILFSASNYNVIKSLFFIFYSTYYFQKSSMNTCFYGSGEQGSQSLMYALVDGESAHLLVIVKYKIWPFIDISLDKIDLKWLAW